MKCFGIICYGVLTPLDSGKESESRRSGNQSLLTSLGLQAVNYRVYIDMETAHRPSSHVTINWAGRIVVNRKGSETGTSTVDEIIVLTGRHCMCKRK